MTTQRVLKIPFGQRSISLGTAVMILQDVGHRTPGDCARLLGLSSRELHLCQSGRWNPDPAVIGKATVLVAEAMK